MDTDSSQVRLGAVGIVALSLFLALFARLWFLQGIERQEFEATSISNRLRVIQTAGPRGRILDRNGKVVVDNRTTIVVSMDREPLREQLGGLDDSLESDIPEIREILLPEFEKVAAALTSLGVPTTADDVWGRFMDKRYSPQEPVPVAEDVSVEVEQFLVERAAEYPGMIVERKTVREYPYGPLASHVLGYVGEINEDELLARGVDVPGSEEEPATTTTIAGQDPKPYEPGDSIGKTGVERAYEPDLRGTPGERTIEVNAKGELLDVVSDTPPESGDDLWLTIDVDLQAYAEEMLADKIETVRRQARYTGTYAPNGAVVITEPTTGEVLAMASYPSYDPRLIVNGIPTALWEQWQDPASGLPLNNWATQGTYAPGSTFKPVTALAGVRSGFLRPGNDTYADGGVYKVQGCDVGKCEFPNSGRAAHGRVDLARSLTVSSNVYYYWIADQLWRGRGTYGETAIQDTAVEFGLGSRTGVDLPGEAAGRIPTPEGRREAYEANPDLFLTDEWFVGDNLNTGVGQGDVLVTPLQLNSVYSTIANGGSVMQPHVAFQTTRALDPTIDPGSRGNYEVVRTIEPVESARVDIPPDRYIEMFEGLVGVTQSGEGTASGAWQANRTAWPFAGKTGTAEVANKVDTSVFAGWGPAVGGQAPTHAISVIIPESGFGGEVAAPLAFSILAPASDGTLPVACPVTEPERSECEDANVALEEPQP